jgi:ketosteroid isomerase-like protein
MAKHIEGSHDQTRILEMIDARNDAIRTGDAARALAPLAADATAYELQPPLAYHGEAARDRKGLEAWFETWDGPVAIEMPDPTISVDGDLAFAYGLCRMRGKKKGEGHVELWYRTTLCLERQHGEWKVVHEHSSVPFRMDGSEKAAHDLRP